MASSIQNCRRPFGPQPETCPPAAAYRRVGWLKNLPEVGRRFLERLLLEGFFSSDTANAFLEARLERLREYASEVQLGQALVESGLLTTFQLERILQGQSHGLLLGNYRVLEQIGSGGMGLVYLGEHSLMRRRVAIKVLPIDDECHFSIRERFHTEMRLLAELNHPHIVQALDAGELPARGPNMPALTYLVMELIAGGDLEHYVLRQGPLAVPQACDWVRQAAQGLQAAHDLHIVHRDIKPSNLLWVQQSSPAGDDLAGALVWGHIKLVDFGLAHQFTSQLTDPRALLGSLEFMAPEQSLDPSDVGPEADVYGLGATLFWLLCGEAPYSYTPNLGAGLRALQNEPPRRLSALRPDVPKELDDLIDQMLSRDASLRPTPLGVATALASLSIASRPSRAVRPISGARHQILSASNDQEARRRKVLLVDDEAEIRLFLRAVLEPMGCSCVEADCGGAALEAARREAFDLVLLDVQMPAMSGKEVCQKLRERGTGSYLKIFFMSGVESPLSLAEMLAEGADDFLLKPFELRRLQARVEIALRVKEEQDRMRMQADQYQRAARQLSLSLEASRADLRQAHDAILYTMAKMAESRDGEAPGHLRRLQRYVVVLARVAASQPAWSRIITPRFLSQIERCIVLHDIGTIGLPDEILHKPASFAPHERRLFQEHTLIGDRLLEALAGEFGNAMDFLEMARDIVRHHHERFDGTGYPDRLAGETIPMAARLTAIPDVYDALRRNHLHRAALPHSQALAIILQQSDGHFDPTLLAAFRICHEQFDRIFREVAD
jgi:response regulator RpfG family c-di-GMP phosphodiesterase/serine/threonine protein kinase